VATRSQKAIQENFRFTCPSPKKIPWISGRKQLCEHRPDWKSTQRAAGRASNQSLVQHRLGTLRKPATFAPST